MRRFGTLAFLGLALCVFTWGLQYKLSLYDPPHAPSHQIPTARLISRNERPDATESPAVAHAKAFTKAVQPMPAAAFLILLMALGALAPPVSRPWEEQANRSWHLRRVLLNSFFVRPPPVLL